MLTIRLALNPNPANDTDQVPESYRAIDLTPFDPEKMRNMTSEKRKEHHQGIFTKQKQKPSNPNCSIQ